MSQSNLVEGEGEEVHFGNKQRPVGMSLKLAVSSQGNDRCCCRNTELSNLVEV